MPAKPEMCALNPFSCLFVVALAEKTKTGFAGNYIMKEVVFVYDRSQRIWERKGEGRGKEKGRRRRRIERGKRNKRRNRIIR